MRRRRVEITPERLVNAAQLLDSGRCASIRKQAGLSQAELGALIGKSHVAVCRWELGQRRPRGADAVAYAEMLQRLEAALARPTSA